ncbi:MAG: hypothetical protein KJ709_05970 [Nanoarchaeota archaeon]|nr:hypothetical protein [Nanoarchaeota archaeon]
MANDIQLDIRVTKKALQYSPHEAVEDIIVDAEQMMAHLPMPEGTDMARVWVKPGDEEGDVWHTVEFYAAGKRVDRLEYV